MKEILTHARNENYAVIAPNVFSEMDARACLEAAEDENSPIILDVAMIHTADIQFHGSYLVRLANQTPVPVAINLDHGHGLQEAVMAIRSGFTSIMVDCSSLPYEENVSQVRSMCQIAHAAGVSVEAELGHVGNGDDHPQQMSDRLTDPDQAAEYVHLTGVDCLAVAIGTAHGAYKGIPHLDFDRLVEIRKKVDCPLVLHGGSGTGDENIAKACRLGINKVNVCNELLERMASRVKETDLYGNHAYEFWGVCMGAIQERLRELMHICGSSGKAWNVAYPKLPHAYRSMREG